MSDLLNVHEYSVSELSGAIKRTLEDSYGYVRVRGEVGRVSRPGSGHIYLDLKDDKAVINGVIWKGQVPRLQIKPEQGLEVVCTGRLTTFPGQSRYQIVIESMEPAGVGALMALLEERRKKLTAEGLFAAEHKKTLPYLPEVIGVVTSPTGAVIRDILHRLSDRFPRHVLVWPTLVQGDKAADQIAAGIDGFNAMTPGGAVPRPDVIIVARGGGSIEDLWPFNEEVVVRAAFASAIPLISAVGHETDTTLIDFASDVRAPTPTAAAEMAVPVRAELLAQVSEANGRLVRAQARLVEQGRVALSGLARGLPKAEDLLAWPAQRLDVAAQNLGRALQLFVEQRFSAFQRRARLSPQSLLIAIARKRERLDADVRQLSAGKARRLERAGDRLDVAARGLARRSLAEPLVRQQQSLDVLGGRLQAAFARGTREREERLQARAQLLRSFSYEGVLERGYAVVLGADGTLVRRAAQASVGDAVTLRFADGEAGAAITDSASADKSVVKPKPKPSAKKGEQGSLF